jgi:hypothetical protein
LIGGAAERGQPVEIGGVVVRMPESFGCPRWPGGNGMV